MKRFGLAGILILGLVSCPDLGILNQNPDLLTGKVENWTRGERIVKAGSFLNGSIVNLPGQTTTNSSGEFSFQLPKESEIAPLLTVQNFAGGCASSTIITSPPSLKGLVVGGLRVFGSTGIAGGQITQATPGGNTQPPTAGSKQIYRFFADSDATVKGVCSFQSNSINYDLTFVKGWNVLVGESGVSIKTATIPNDAKWYYTSTGQNILTIVAPSLNLQLGKTSQYTATVTDSDGTPIVPVPKITWASANPDVISIDNTGLVTTKHFGKTQITATSNVVSGIGSTVNVNVYGMDIKGGTLNKENASLGTALGIRYRAPGVVVAPQDVALVVTGPNGWNKNQTMALNLPAGEDTALLIAHAEPVVGTYTVQTQQPLGMSVNVPDFGMGKYPQVYKIESQTRTGSEIISSSFKIDSVLDSLAQTANIKISEIQTDRFLISWDIVTGNPNIRYQIQVVDKTTNTVLKTQLALGFTGAQQFISGLNLVPNHENIVYVYAIDSGFLTDAVYLNTQMNVSRAIKLLDFSPAIVKLNASGGSSLGNYRIRIEGSNFTDTATVLFGNTPATVISNSLGMFLEVIAPPHIAGSVPISITNNYGFINSNQSSIFRYYDTKEFDVNRVKNMTKGLNGDVWFIENTQNNEPPPSTNPYIQLSKINLNGNITHFDIFDSYLYRDNTSIFDMTCDSNGNIWITTGASSVIKVSSNGVKTEYILPNGGFSMITVGLDGNIWLGETGNYKIARIKPDGSSFVEFNIPGTTTSGGLDKNGDMLLAPDGNVWFTDIKNEKIGKVTLDGTVTLSDRLINFNMTGAVGALSIGQDNNVWTKGNYGLIKLLPNFIPSIINELDSYNEFDPIRMTRGVDNQLWYQTGGPFVSGNLGITNIDGTTKEIVVTPYGDFVRDVVADSSGNIWYARANKIGIIKP